MQNFMVVSTFSVFYRKYLFRVNLAQKLKVVSLTWNLVLRPIRISTIHWWCSLLQFSTGNTLSRAHLAQKIKVVSLTRNLVLRLMQISRIQWWHSLLLFSTGNSLFRQFSPKNQNRQFRLKFGTYANSNMQNSMVMFTPSVFDRKYPFWTNLVQKVKIVSLSWNLVPTIIFTMFWDLLTFYKIFFSPQVKRRAIVTYRHGI